MYFQDKNTINRLYMKNFKLHQSVITYSNNSSKGQVRPTNLAIDCGYWFEVVVKE
jgi:hypothetical protein